MPRKCQRELKRKRDHVTIKSIIIWQWPLLEFLTHPDAQIQFPLATLERRIRQYLNLCLLLPLTSLVLDYYDIRMFHTTINTRMHDYRSVLMNSVMTTIRNRNKDVYKGMIVFDHDCWPEIIIIIRRKTSLTFQFPMEWFDTPHEKCNVCENNLTLLDREKYEMARDTRSRIDDIPCRLCIQRKSAGFLRYVDFDGDELPLFMAANR